MGSAWEAGAAEAKDRHSAAENRGSCHSRRDPRREGIRFGGKGLSIVWDSTKDPAQCSSSPEARKAKRRAAQVAIAIDGLADRAKGELGLKIDQVRDQVATLCQLNGVKRDGCFDWVRGIANAYKHHDLTDKRFLSNDDVLAAGLGYGLDGYGISKFGGVEIIVNDKGGEPTLVEMNQQRPRVLPLS
jgi:hypothetical protein